MSNDNQTVSLTDEDLVLVDEKDNIVGFEDRDKCHDGEGLLHRAFSIFLFNHSRHLLIQRRSNQKRLWPMYWSNSCCSHPKRNEENEVAIQRCLKEELGISVPLKFLFKFQYHAKFNKKGAEYENCAVYLGTSNETIEPNPNEIADWKFIDLQELQSEISDHPERFTPWFKIELERILRDHRQDI